MIGNSKMKSFRLVRLMRLAKLGQYSCQLVKHSTTTRRFVNGKLSQICANLQIHETRGFQHPLPFLAATTPSFSAPPTSVRR